MVGETSKRYKPVIINNPVTTCQIVGLQPNQPIRLQLPIDFNEKVVLKSEYYKINGVIELDTIREYDITSSQNSTGRNTLSNFYMGEIQVGTKSNLILYLTNKNILYKNTVTVLSPEFESIRLKPQSILEVIFITNGMMTWPDRWNWKWHGTSLAVEMEQIETRLTYSSFLKDNVFGKTSVNMINHSGNNANYVQHHFWLRFDKSIIHLLDQSKRSAYVGKIYFSRDTKSSAVIDVFVDLNDRYLDETKSLINSTKKTHICQKPLPITPVRRSVSLEIVHFESLSDGCIVEG